MKRSCDTHILIYALNRQCSERTQAGAFLDEAWSDPQFAIFELSLTELDGLLRNPVLWPRPYCAPDAVTLIQMFRSNRRWSVIDYPGGLMDEVWRLATAPLFTRQGICDARLAPTLRHHGVDEFATRNVKHVTSYGFGKVWDPLED